MLSTLRSRFDSLVGEISPPPVISSVAFPLPGGLNGAAAAFNGDIETDIYARPHNPTVRAFADTINKLDGGAGATAYSSGQAAVRNVLQLLTRQDTEVVLSNHIFGGTVALSSLLGKYGVRFKWADATDPASFEKQITNKTRAFFVESVSNPGGDVADLKGLGDLARIYNIPLIVDNTTSPLLLRPADYGVHLIVYSATKYLNGHGNAIAGVAIDTGIFAWEADRRYPELSLSVGGAPSVAKKYGQKALTKALHSQLTVDGSILSPTTANIIHENLKTLPERLQAHIDNTMAVAEFLNGHRAVERVHYAGLKNDPNHERAKTYLPHGVAGTIMVTLKGGRDAAEHLVNTFTHAVNIGDSRQTLVSHPATTTHRQLSEEQRAAIGIKPGSLRLSISAQDVQQTLHSLKTALRLIP